MKIYQLCKTVTAKGTFFFIDGKRVSRDKFQECKFGRRMDCFFTRATRHSVKDFMSVYSTTEG